MSRSRASVLLSRCEAPPQAKPRRQPWGAGQEPTLVVMAKTEKTEREEKLEQQRRDLPDAPGVYVFRDRGGNALYVGKANSIRKRVASHFAGKSGGRGPGLGGRPALIDRTE